MYNNIIIPNQPVVGVSPLSRKCTRIDKRVSKRFSGTCSTDSSGLCALPNRAAVRLFLLAHSYRMVRFGPRHFSTLRFGSVRFGSVRYPQVQNKTVRLSLIPAFRRNRAERQTRTLVSQLLRNRYEYGKSWYDKYMYKIAAAARRSLLSFS